MQKKIIALAVAGLVSGAAFAQSNVTVYGIVDMGYQYSFDNKLDNVKAMHDIKSGGLDGSRVGVKGVEDLGNGLKAEFDATWNFKSDYNSAVSMGEGSSVALSGNWGKVRAGYFGDFLDDNTGVDASGRHGAIHTGTLYDTGKYANFLAYYSPTFSGLQFKAGVSSNALTADNSPSNLGGLTGNLRAYTAAVSYENGPIKAGVAYASYKPETNDNFSGNDDSSYDWNAGVQYNFGVATVSVFGAQQKIGALAGPNFNAGLNASTYDKSNFWALGVNAPVGANDVIKAGYGQTKLKGVNGNSDVKGVAWDIVYLHSLSKRTTAYAMYGNLGGSDDGYLATQASATSGIYQQMVNVGIRHTF